MFSQEINLTNLQDNFSPLPELSEDELFAMEREVIGFLINKNPLTNFQDIIANKATKKIGEINNDDVGKNLILAGIISGRKVIKTKKDNSDMAFINLYDETGSIEVIAFPKTFAKLKAVLAMNRVIIFKGKVNDRDSRLSVLMENAVDLELYKKQSS